MSNRKSAFGMVVIDFAVFLFLMGAADADVDVAFEDDCFRQHEKTQKTEVGTTKRSMRDVQSLNMVMVLTTMTIDGLSLEKFLLVRRFLF
jgi:multisubunit Na+/H+ antiporter MnhC subunit